jgi:hypothetical protein
VSLSREVWYNGQTFLVLTTSFFVLPTLPGIGLEVGTGIEYQMNQKSQRKLAALRWSRLNLDQRKAAGFRRIYQN